MFADYSQLVLQEFNQRKAANLLSARLARPKPARVKEECLAICHERYLRKDDEILRRFFGQSGDLKTTLQGISKCEPAKFKPLINFIDGKTANPDEKIIELLAWLIDFEERPFVLGKVYKPKDTIVSETNDKVTKSYGSLKEDIIVENFDSPSEEKQENSGKRVFYGKPDFKFTLIILIALVTVLAFTGVFHNWWVGSNGLQRCMYWTGDHYQLVSCNQKMGGTLVVGYDSLRFHKFKKITSPDTITLNAIGYVWYMKRENNYEYYTYFGYHPVYTHLRLRPITAYIINKHILAEK